MYAEEFISFEKWYQSTKSSGILVGTQEDKTCKSLQSGDFRDWIRVQNNIPMEHNFLYKQTIVLTATSFA